jgi:hypothetical protein
MRYKDHKVFFQGKTFQVCPVCDCCVDIASFVENLREKDRLELERVFGHIETPREAVERSIRDSERVWTAWVCPGSSIPVAVWGVQRIQGPSVGGPLRVGCAWMVGTPEIYRDVREFLYLSRLYHTVMEAGFDVLYQMVDATYTEALRWLKWLGYDQKTMLKLPDRDDLVAFVVKKVTKRSIQACAEQ